MEGITLDASEEIYEVAGKASVDLDEIGKDWMLGCMGKGIGGWQNIIVGGWRSGL
jgi:hypothetical protein